MEIPCIIPPTTAAVTKVINTARDGRPGCIMAIGPLGSSERILIQRPLIHIDPDPDNNAHWATLKQNDDEAVLRDGHDAHAIPVGVILRVVKPATATAVGVSWA